MIARDVSERKRAERELTRTNEELRRVNDLLQEYVSVEPLSSINELAQTLRGQWSELSDEEKLRILSSLEEEAKRLKQVSDAILDPSRLDVL
jgi:light-regulated signal transduction histidine kinase (bacteriophytochrome)